MECLDRCEFLDFGYGNFECKYYNKRLLSSYNELIKRTIINRCNECINEGFIGSNTLEELLKNKEINHA